MGHQRVPLIFGGLLLLSGRAGDLLGRRRVFLGGLALFSLSSLAGGLAPTAGALLVAGGPLFVRESRATQPATRSSDVRGALLGTGGLLALVLGVIRAEPLGWTSARVIALLAGGATLLWVFVVVERRAAAPLVPLRLFRSRRLLTGVNATDAYASGVLPGSLLFGAGIIFVGVPNQIAAVVDVQNDDAGAASGVLSSVYQVGGALGLAIITTLSATRVTHALAGGATQAAALTAGYRPGGRQPSSGSWRRACGRMQTRCCRPPPPRSDGAEFSQRPPGLRDR